MIPLHRTYPLALLAAGFLVAGSAPAASAPACATVTSGKAVDEIRTLEEAGGQSNVKGMSLEDGKRMFAESFMSFGPDGAVKTRDDILKTYVDGRMAPWASSFVIKELEVKVYCDTATVIGLSEVTAKNAAPDA